jgi:hypothetical protein
VKKAMEIKKRKNEKWRRKREGNKEKKRKEREEVSSEEIEKEKEENFIMFSFSPVELHKLNINDLFIVIKYKNEVYYTIKNYLYF